MRKPLMFFYLLTTLVVSAQHCYLFVGTYTSTDSKGIYIYKFDNKTGKLTWVANTNNEIVNPSFLTVTNDGKFIYACTDTRSEKEGSVSSFSFDRTNNTIKFINKQPSGGANPVFISVHKSNTFFVNSNYTGSNITVFGINADKSIQPFSQEIKLTGNSANKERQEKAHPHSVNFSPDFNYLAVPDLGSDKIMTYQVNEKETQPLKATKYEFVTAVPGSGPRHLAFHPNQKFAYCIEELTGTVQAYIFKDGKLDTLQRIKAHPEDSVGLFSSADIHVSPDGKFLYASNRSKENNLAIFSIDVKGKLTLQGYQSTLGLVPRNFTIDPSGNYILVANQASGFIIVFKRDLKTGKLTETGERVNVPLPSCLQMKEVK